MAKLGLRRCTQTFSSCSESGATLHLCTGFGGFSCCRTWAVGHIAQPSAAVARWAQ